MRTTVKYISAAMLGILVLAGCDNNEIDVIQGIDGPHISLTLNTGDQQVVVKSDVVGEDTYNENLINTIHYFFFAKGSTSTAVVQGSESGLSKKASYTMDIPVSSSNLTDMFPSSGLKCDLFIIANAPESMADLLGGNPTLAQLRTASVISNMNKVPQSNFVMVYDGEAEVSSTNQADLTVTAEMKRLACKFTFKADVLSLIETNDGTRDISWRPSTDADALTVTFGNALNVTTPAGFDKTKVDEDKDYFETSPVELEYNGETEDKTIDSKIYKTYTAKSPVYSYPMEWVFTDNFEPYILYDLIWDYDDGANQHQEHRYYKLMLGQQSITSNDWYVVTAKLTGLGNLLPRDPLVLFSGLNYSVKDWTKAFDNENTPNTPSNIRNASFLMVPQTSLTMNNEEVITIPFTSSHSCTISDLKATKTSFYNTASGNYDHGAHTTVNIDVIYPDNHTDPASLSEERKAKAVKVEFTNSTREIKVTHTLNNNLNSSTMDISPIVITFKLKHDGVDPVPITITQYPQIWVETIHNSDKPNEGNENYNNKGYAYINNAQNDVPLLPLTTDYQRIGGASGSWTANGTDNSSRYLTVIHVSRISDFPIPWNSSSIPAVIGDPRVTTGDGSSLSTEFAGKTNYQTTNVLYDGTTPRGLKYYYPTVDDGTKSHFIAPAFRVCSAHIRNGEDNSYNDAVLRCATYQEDGYPAGRWRLPTKAECLLFTELAKNSLIPTIFQTGNYMYAYGYFNINKYTNPITITYYDARKGSASPRCVYDEWYWSEIDAKIGRKHGDELTDAQKKKFVWGDMPRNYDPAKIREEPNF